MLKRVGTSQGGMSLDMEVRAVSGCRPSNASRNGLLKSGFGRINVANGTSCELEFTFMLTETQEPVTVAASVVT